MIQVTSDDTDDNSSAESWFISDGEFINCNGEAVSKDRLYNAEAIGVCWFDLACQS